MDGKGRWIDNVFIERLWRSVKYEEVYLHAYTNGTEARAGLTRYFSFYNARRSHQSLDYQTPDELYFGELAAATPLRRLTDDSKSKDRRASAGFAGRPRDPKTIDEDQRARDDHHQPLRQIHSSRREICPNKRSHP